MTQPLQSLTVVEIPVKVCRNCKYWGPGTIDDRPDPYGMLLCLQLQATELVGAEAHGVGAAIATKPDFGCVLFEGKEET